MMADIKRKVPNLRFKGFTDDWEQRKLGDVVNLIGGGPFKSTDSVSKGIPWLKIANVGVNGITWNTESYLPEYLWNDYPQYQLKKGNYVVALTRPILNHRLKISKLDRNALLNQRVAKLTTSENLQYIVHLLERKKVVLQIENNLSGSDPPNLSSKDLYRIKIKIPSESNEQKQIGTFLTKLDSIISLQQRKLDLLKQLKKGFLQKMFAEKNNKQPVLRFKGFHDDWEQRKLGEVAEKVYSGLSGKTKSDFEHGEAAYVTYINVHDNVIAKAKEIEKVEVDLKQNQVQKGDIFFTISSEVPEEVALNSVWPYETNTRLYLNSFCFGYRSNFKLVNPFFLSYYLRSPHLRQIIFPLAQGISRFNISKKSILQLPIKLPKLQEQKDIYRILQDLENLLSLQHQKLAKYQSVKKSLLQQMFI